MELVQARYFLALSQTRNAAQAAERCNVAPSALTRVIQRLEGELGGLLFTRTPGPLRLTVLGEAVAPHLGELVARAEAARRAAQRLVDAQTPRPIAAGPFAMPRPSPWLHPPRQTAAAGPMT